jgi:hypothetical protein
MQPLARRELHAPAVRRIGVENLVDVDRRALSSHGGPIDKPDQKGVGIV